MSNKLKVAMETDWVPGVHDDDGILLSEFLQLTSPIVEPNAPDRAGSVYEVFRGEHCEPTLADDQKRLVVLAYVEVVAGPADILNSQRTTMKAWQTLCDTTLFEKLAKFGGRNTTVSEAAATVEFSSAVSAVEWAREVQAKISRPARDVNTDGLRVCISIGIGEICGGKDERYLSCAHNDPASLKQFNHSGGIVLSSLVHELVKPHGVCGDSVIGRSEVDEFTDEEALFFVLN